MIIQEVLLKTIYGILTPTVQQQIQIQEEHQAEHQESLLGKNPVRCHTKNDANY